MQTLTNILGNAVKFSPAGSTVTVETRRRSSDGAAEVVFRVTDQRSRQCRRDMLEAIFEPFEQVDSSDSRAQGGTGLGLAISRGIVERHGGRIWAESEPGLGHDGELRAARGAEARGARFAARAPAADTLSRR